jgi:hypothetical protein
MPHGGVKSTQSGYDFEGQCKFGGDVARRACVSTVFCEPSRLVQFSPTDHGDRT